MLLPALLQAAGVAWSSQRAWGKKLLWARAVPYRPGLGFPTDAAGGDLGFVPPSPSCK